MLLVAEEEKINSVVEREGVYLVALLRSSLRDELPCPRPPEGLRWRVLFELASKHLVDSAVYFALKKDPSVCSAEVLAQFKGAADNALRIELMYDAERAAVLGRLDEAGIDHVPLKGIIIKNYYPHRGMRRFSDNDVLYDKSKRKRLKKLMKEMGYTWEHTTDYSAHIAFHKPPVFCFEMHHALFSRELQRPYFAGIFKRVVPSGGAVHELAMTPEDFYVYTVGHLAQHYLRGGSGLKTFADLYLVRRNLKFNRAVVDRALAELELAEFEAMAVAAAERWLGDGEGEVDFEMLKFVITSGAYGSTEHVLAASVERNGRAGSVFKLVFLPFKEMKARFPFLKYLPFLLPLCWIYRFFRAFFSRKKIKKAIATVKYSMKKDD